MSHAGSIANRRHSDKTDARFNGLVPDFVAVVPGQDGSSGASRRLRLAAIEVL
jgi:hypothetical protein